MDERWSSGADRFDRQETLHPDVPMWAVGVGPRQRWLAAGCLKWDGMRQSATIVIERPASDVFSYVMEVAHDAQWRTGIVEAGYTSDGPLGVGSTGFDRISANGRDMVAEWTAVEYEPGRLARWRFDSGPLEGSGGYVCEQAEAGTRFTLEADVKPTGMYRFLGPIYGVIVRRLNLADVRRLKSILEDAT